MVATTHRPASETGTAEHRLHRPRLEALLTAAGRARAIAVYGPAGAGKTTLVWDWLARSPEAGAVVSVDCADLGPDRPVDLATHAGGRTGPVTVVLDGVEAVPDASLRAQVDRFVADRPSARVVLVGRHGPGSDGAWTGNPIYPVAVDAADLAFTSAETAELALSRGLDLSPAAVHGVFAVTGGWVAGLVIALDAMAGLPRHREPDVDQLLRAGAGLDEYVWHDVLGELTPDARDAVRLASVAESVNADLFAALTGRPDGAALLAGLARNGAFATRVGRYSEWFRYHRLWRTALYTALVNDDPVLAHRLHRVAGAWYTVHGQPGEALRQAIAGHDHPLAARLARTQADAIRHSPARTVATATTAPAAPAPWPPSSPWPPPDDAALGSAWQALCRGEPDAARRAVDTVARPSYGSVLCVRAMIELQQGHLDRAGRLAARTRAVLHREGVTGSHDEGWALLVLSGVARLRGCPQPAHHYLDELLVEVWPGTPALLANATFHRIEVLRQQGGHGPALVALERLIAEEADLEVLPAWAPRAMRIQLLLSEGLLHDAQRRWEADAQLFPPVVADLGAATLLLAHRPAGRADPRVDELLRPYLAGPTGCLPHDVDVRLVLAHAAQRLGDTAASAGLLREAREIAARERLWYPFTVDRGLPRLADTAPDRSAVPAVLTVAETDVLRMLVGFMTVAEVAAALRISPNTVKTHTSAIYHKLGVHRRRDAIRRARELGLL
ncbi:hypothetical protein GCM10010399_28550 [Dactylosporangium fulvum]|uniref:LuxR C-terminal-related transcriptional regulator n=1 Tax=Dactylosporangium fulvum TaxID=53359 RepID=A0ABY5W8A3_9ACTN|nr:LuxR C-terminal-related transcriptional regulator [Dactylosporangium fulvum]UWP86275.1 LuxR C-terminal-related transcriptional regulator [Dactylosporangium fulvum]